MIHLLYPSSKRSNSKFQCNISVLCVNHYLWHKREWSIFKHPHPLWLAREERFGDSLKRLPKVTWQLQAFVSVPLLRWAFLQEFFVFWCYAALSNGSRYFQKRLNLSMYLSSDSLRSQWRLRYLRWYLVLGLSCRIRPLGSRICYDTRGDWQQTVPGEQRACCHLICTHLVELTLQALYRLRSDQERSYDNITGLRRKEKGKP